MGVPEISVDELAVQMDSGAQILDVRELDEWNEGRISGSRLMPLGEVIERTDEISTNEPVYVICRSGVRSASACEYLRTQGVDAVNVAGGILAWLESQRSVERDQQ
ncbi:MAG: rhodanese-like domain-containing protein [Actinomycetota bacterium]|jgi:rhodanese-related sulfurtransferase|nr:sulfurtransferase [Acidimicrobiaceae bacterium]MEC7916436.1 rhodanese-like domain-containing protein [Actinomycetota bacterium]MEC9057953.1 rhodanese-like domain-containing protein [Actinomycetota bacterium]MEC9474202.1 rhodanese-like domain-containing protein [Actinomycetota bacterium]MEE3257099.1 rhodanese-like domain-containing protein [Actinomycetota bacterium]